MCNYWETVVGLYDSCTIYCETFFNYGWHNRIGGSKQSQIESLVLKGRIHHFVMWQIPPFDTKVTIDFVILQLPLIHDVFNQLYFRCNRKYNTHFVYNLSKHSRIILQPMYCQ